MLLLKKTHITLIYKSLHLINTIVFCALPIIQTLNPKQQTLICQQNTLYIFLNILQASD